MARNDEKNKGKFRIGTVFQCCVNGAVLQVVDIFKKDFTNCNTVCLKDLHSGKTTYSNIPTLERLNAEILFL